MLLCYYKEWLRPTSKQFIKPSYSISRATPIESHRCRLPTTNQRSRQQSGQIALQSVMINKAKFLTPTRHAETRKNIIIPGSVVLRPWAGEAGARASIQSFKALCIPEQRPRNLARSPLLVGPRRKKANRVQMSIFTLETSLFAPPILAHKGSLISTHSPLDRLVQ